MRSVLLVFLIIVTSVVAFAAGAYADSIAERISPMAISQKIVRLDVYDADGVGDINVDFHYEISTNNAEAASLGVNKRVVVLQMEGTRAAIASAIAAIRDASLVVNDGGWPEGALPLPRPRKP